MEKTKVKKHLHLNPEEKKHVAKMIDTGATLAEVDKWYQMRFGKKITRSVYYDLKKKCKTILAETDGKKTTNKYTRKGEKDLEPFEEHLKLRISENTESSGSFKWTYALLQSLAEIERLKEPFNQSQEIQKMCFSPQKFEKYHVRQTICPDF